MASPYTGYSSTQDGSLYVGNASYATVRSATTGTLDTSTIYLGNELVGIYYIYRGYLYFDTSTIPVGAIIISATLSIFGNGVTGPENDNIQIVSTTAHDTLEAGDFDLVGSTPFNDTAPAFSTMSQVAYTVIELNASGIANIVLGGATKFALRAKRDIDGTTPSDRSFIQIFTSEDATEAKHPLLTVNYIEGTTSTSSSTSTTTTTTTSTSTSTTTTTTSTSVTTTSTSTTTTTTSTSSSTTTSTSTSTTTTTTSTSTTFTTTSTTTTTTSTSSTTSTSTTTTTTIPIPFYVENVSFAGFSSEEIEKPKYIQVEKEITNSMIVEKTGNK